MVRRSQCRQRCDQLPVECATSSRTRAAHLCRCLVRQLGRVACGCNRQAQLGQEAVKAAAHFGNTTAASNRYAYYVILSPTRHQPGQLPGFVLRVARLHRRPRSPAAPFRRPTVIWRSAISRTTWTRVPVVAWASSTSPGTLDGYTMTLGHEWHEMMSDQFPAGGWTNHTGSSYNGQENSDECAWIAAGSAPVVRPTSRWATAPTRSRPAGPTTPTRARSRMRS